MKDFTQDHAAGSYCIIMGKAAAKGRVHFFGFSYATIDFISTHQGRSSFPSQHKDFKMTVDIKWFPPSWFQIKTKGIILYIDPAFKKI